MKWTERRARFNSSAQCESLDGWKIIDFVLSLYKIAPVNLYQPWMKALLVSGVYACGTSALMAEGVLVDFEGTGNTFLINGDFLGPSLTNNTASSITIRAIDFEGFEHEGGRIGFALNRLATHFFGETFSIGVDGVLEEPFVVPVGATFIFQFNQELADDRLGVRTHTVQQGAPGANDSFDYNFTTIAFSEFVFSTAIFLANAPVFTVHETVPVSDPLEILSFNKLTSQEGYRLEFTANEGSNYIIQGRASLEDGVWLPIPVFLDPRVPGVVTILTSNLPAEASERFFFRVVER